MHGSWVYFLLEALVLWEDPWLRCWAELFYSIVVEAEDIKPEVAVFAVDDVQISVQVTGNNSNKKQLFKTNEIIINYRQPL